MEQMAGKREIGILAVRVMIRIMVRIKFKLRVTVRVRVRAMVVDRVKVSVRVKSEIHAASKIGDCSSLLPLTLALIIAS